MKRASLPLRQHTRNERRSGERVVHERTPITLWCRGLGFGTQEPIAGAISRMSTGEQYETA